MRCRIKVDEVWPVFSLDEGWLTSNNEVEVEEQFYAEYKAFMANYQILQKKLSVLYYNRG